MDPEPVTAAQAGSRLGRTPATIRKWQERYAARTLGKAERRVYYDYADLATIDACIHRGDHVPETPELRDRLRDSYSRAA
ncbi:hypothetical protein [Nonomuraea sp. NPDC050310]|uniref:hypothetical protein n=1 Tax=Nonomuraea sp. NPDC050310 TaxID=3154935 RepID=UPI0033D99CF5